MTTQLYTRVSSPIGELLLTGTQAGLDGLYLQPNRGTPALAAGSRRTAAPFAVAIQQLAAYFAGELRDFDLPLAPRGTPFQQDVWRALRLVPYGATTSYGKLAADIGRPGAARAVGLANRVNPICIVVPCHRVIGANGTLTGYAGGLDNKRALLEHERAVLARPPTG